MSGDTPPITSVTGGAPEGLALVSAICRELATAYDDAGSRLRETAADTGQTLADPDLLESAALSPLTFAAAEASVLAATTGPDGALVESVAWEADAVLIRGTVDALEASDRVLSAGFELLDHQLGVAIGIAAPAALGAAVLGYAAYRLQPGRQPSLGPLARESATGLQRLLIDNPRLTQRLLNSGGGMVDGVLRGPAGAFGPHHSTESAAATLARLYPADGRPRADRASDIDLDLSRPRNLRELMANLERVATLSPDPDSPNNGAMAIQRVEGSDGKPAYVVYVPGTDRFNAPWDGSDDVRGMKANLQALGGGETTHARAVVEALKGAGVGPSDRVLLAGHSQGGLVAGYLAGHPGGFNVTDVVTAAAPMAHLGPFPHDVRVLSLENERDLVPLLDGEDNAARTNHVTVRFDGGDFHPPGEDRSLSPVEAEHFLDKYVAGGQSVDDSEDPDLRRSVERLREGFLGAPQHAAAPTTEVWRLSQE